MPVPLIYHHIYSDLPLPEGHRYPINKYRLLYQEIESCYLREDASSFELFEPIALNASQLIKVHCPVYVDALLQGTLPAAKMRRIGFPWSQALIDRTLTSAGGTCLTVEKALEYGVAIHLSGGYHHAHYDYGSGFCLVNDLALAAQHALNAGAEKVLIIDSDVHHGDGTATLMADNAQVVTLSFHCEKNFPARKPASDLDVPLIKGLGDQAFLATFGEVVDLALRLHNPDFIIYDAGVDIHIDDELGYLSVTTEGIAKRDEWLLTRCLEAHIPVACVIGGGYRSQHSDLIPIHMNLINAAKSIWGHKG
ncbi:histone deacetylase family protein [Vibrio methylphosphonaticus]|uniref:histone deacetylase family protein n=1 Tax=Vibrio methylphosphonaticus TaxID=2946866 RepID=UPI00202A2757|nr:histone deacetylase [Vibrio methylphosphonaticus]MCL9774583.1 histone deacetylase [Vibrio methylphosphonaticus]